MSDSVPRAPRSGQLDAPATQPGDSDTPPLICTFCGKASTQVRKLIAGPRVFICDECVEICVQIIRQATPEPGAWKPIGTAPRDGTQIMLWDGHDVSCAEFHTGPDGSAWWELAHDGTRATMLRRDATHWQPRPEPPK